MNRGRQGRLRVRSRPATGATEGASKRVRRASHREHCFAKSCHVALGEAAREEDLRRLLYLRHDRAEDVGDGGGREGKDDHSLRRSRASMRATSSSGMRGWTRQSSAPSRKQSKGSSSSVPSVMTMMGTSDTSRIRRQVSQPFSCGDSIPLSTKTRSGE